MSDTITISTRTQCLSTTVPFGASRQGRDSLPRQNSGSAARLARARVAEWTRAAAGFGFGLCLLSWMASFVAAVL